MVEIQQIKTTHANLKWKKMNTDPQFEKLMFIIQ